MMTKEYKLPNGKIIMFDYDAYGVGQVTLEAMDRIVDLLCKMTWIPCSKRLPDMWDERYLVSLAWGGIGVMEYKSTGFHNYGSFSPVPIESVVAWMPLPEPYEEDDKWN